MHRGILTADSVAFVPEAQGVYQLFLDDDMVYIGKTDAQAGLNKRLARHAKKILDRHNLEPKRVSFKAVRIYVFTVMDLEQQLIQLYRKTGVTLNWNDSGFGSNDPGRERDTTKLKDTHFDIQYPVNIDVPIELPQLIGTQSVADVLLALKNILPYTLRYESPKSKSYHELIEEPISLSTSHDTVRNILLQIKQTLGDAWQITVLPGYIILYREAKTYIHGTIL